MAASSRFVVLFGHVLRDDRAIREFTGGHKEALLLVYPGGEQKTKRFCRAC